MKLEYLANELLLDLFGYLNIIDLFRAFYGLNFRFNQLLFNDQYRCFHLNLRAVSKVDFDFIYQQHLSILAPRILSLSLSNDDDTPDQLACFLSHDFSLRQFIHLRSLSLYHIRFDKSIYKILQDLPHLPHLTSLTIDGCQYQFDQENLLHLFNIIWNLPNLIHCHLKDFSTNYNYSELTFPEAISSSIEYLTIENVQFTLNQLFNLFQSTPHLRSLHSTITNCSNLNRPVLHAISSLTALKIEFSPVSFLQIRDLLQYLPNLIHLSFFLESIKINGYQWEQMITDYLPKLKVFQLIMSIAWHGNNDRERVVDELLNSFRTPFWIDIHQWFVRCDWTRGVNYQFGTPYLLLYTLPYFQHFFYYSEISHSKSTCPNEKDYWSYDHVDDLLLNDVGFVTYTLQYPIRFPSLQRLRISSFLLHPLGILLSRLDHLVELYDRI